MSECLSVSIIIPFKDIDDYVRECIAECQELDYKNFEIILVPDKQIKYKIPKLTMSLIESGPGYPSGKRNKAVKQALGEIIAFIDSDAIPRKDWITNAVKIFEDPKVAAVGGPNLVPKDAGVKERANVDIIYSKLCAGGSYPLKKYKNNLYEYRELAGSNLFIRKTVFEEFGGFDEYLLTSEDSKLCFQIRASGRKVIYSPDVVVYHHRRGLFLKHAKRTLVQGRDKAFLIKERPSKDAFVYLIPSLFTLGLIFGPILTLTTRIVIVGALWSTIVILYLFLIFYESLKVLRKPERVSIFEPIFVFLGLPITHISYGIGFLLGLFQNKKKVRSSWKQF